MTIRTLGAGVIASFRKTLALSLYTGKRRLSLIYGYAGVKRNISSNRANYGLGALPASFPVRIVSQAIAMRPP